MLVKKFKVVNGSTQKTFFRCQKISGFMLNNQIWKLHSDLLAGNKMIFKMLKTNSTQLKPAYLWARIQSFYALGLFVPLTASFSFFDFFFLSNRWKQ